MAQETVPIIGSDGQAPVYDPNGLWKEWNMAELYVGQAGAGKWVPNVEDYARDIPTNTSYRVTSVDPTTFIPTFVVNVNNTNSGVLSDVDILLGANPGQQNETYRVYLNQKTLPFTLSVERRCFVRGVDAKYAMIFRGSDLTSNQKVISQMYDASNNLLGQQIPLVLSEFVGNVAQYYVPTCWTTENMPNDEIVFVAFYAADGTFLSKQQLIVENSDFIAGPNNGVKYITGISLETPFLSQADATLLKYPLNVLMQGLNLMGKVQYSDNTNLLMPIDGTKFRLDGLENTLASVSGQELDLVLNYNLSVGEVAYGGNIGDNRNLWKDYRAQVQSVDGSYSVKLFVCPVWIDSLNGYRLEFFLANLERTNIWRVTPYVRVNTNTRVFDPLAYGILQRMSFNLNLHDVNGTFNNWYFNQVVDVTLMAPGTDRTSNWSIGYTPTQNPPYGVGNNAVSTFVSQNQYRVKIDNGMLDQASWLERLYSRTLPLFDPAKEVAAPTPTHFAFDFINGVSIEFPIIEWNVEHVVNQPLNNSDTLMVRFFKRTVDNDIQLAVAGLPIWQSN